MSNPRKVYFCDCCNRVIAEEDPDGVLVIRVRHDREMHETRIILMKNGAEEGVLTKVVGRA